VLNLFQGYPFDIQSQTFDLRSQPCDIDCSFKMNVIQPFLDHILNIICDHELDLYTYILNWITHLIQKPGSKTEKALVIIGEQGTGKSKFFTDIISKLFGRYCISNENNISNIISRLNSSIENKILIVCNELQSI
jgi:putative DNA primase/helicase